MGRPAFDLVHAQLDSSPGRWARRHLPGAVALGLVQVPAVTWTPDGDPNALLAPDWVHRLVAAAEHAFDRARKGALPDEDEATRRAQMAARFADLCIKQLVGDPDMQAALCVVWWDADDKGQSSRAAVWTWLCLAAGPVRP